MGLRELKKQKTKKAISDMATKLFVERGYHAVTTAEIAEKAEVSVPTLFNYFPTKESLVFDEDAEMEQKLVDSVLKRPKGESVFEALLNEGLKSIDEMPEENLKEFSRFMKLINETPELNLYSKQMWMRHEAALAVAIRKESRKKLTEIESESIAHFVLDSYHRAIGATKPKAALHSLFKILSDGWSEA